MTALSDCRGEGEKKLRWEVRERGLALLLNFLFYDTAIRTERGNFLCI